jgi:hypothetical protein
MRSLSLAAALVLVACAAHADTSRSGPSRFAPAVLPEPPVPSHSIPFSAVILKGSGWTREAVQPRLAEVQRIIAQCGVRLDLGPVVEGELPGGGTELLYDRKAASAPNGLGTVTQLLRPRAGPALFYFAHFLDFKQPGTARPAWTDAGTAQLDTAWIAFPPDEGQSYSVDAHELVHVLADTSHSSLPRVGPPSEKPKRDDSPQQPRQDGGLMSKYGRDRSNVIGDALCAKMKLHPAAVSLGGSR